MACACGTTAVSEACASGTLTRFLSTFSTFCTHPSDRGGAFLGNKDVYSRGARFKC